MSEIANDLMNDLMNDSMNDWMRDLKSIICDALHALVPFLQFNKREKHPWRSVTFRKIVFLNFANGTNTSHYTFYEETQQRTALLGLMKMLKVLKGPYHLASSYFFCLKFYIV